MLFLLFFVSFAAGDRSSDMDEHRDGRNHHRSAKGHEEHHQDDRGHGKAEGIAARQEGKEKALER